MFYKKPYKYFQGASPDMPYSISGVGLSANIQLGLQCSTMAVRRASPVASARLCYITVRLRLIPLLSLSQRLAANKFFANFNFSNRQIPNIFFTSSVTFQSFICRIHIFQNYFKKEVKKSENQQIIIFFYKKIAFLKN